MIDSGNDQAQIVRMNSTQKQLSLISAASKSNFWSVVRPFAPQRSHAALGLGGRRGLALVSPVTIPLKPLPVKIQFPSSKSSFLPVEFLDTAIAGSGPCKAINCKCDGYKPNNPKNDCCRRCGHSWHMHKDAYALGQLRKLRNKFGIVEKELGSPEHDVCDASHENSPGTKT